MAPRPVRTLPETARLALIALALAACAFGVVRAVQVAWVSDDAFLSFRYAERLLQGQGLVFNVGERVEGYTNFLWTLAMVPGLALGLDPVPWSQGLGLACFAALLALVAFAGPLAAPAPDRPRPRLLPRAVPVAAAALALNPAVREFATGGLETMAFTLLVTAATLVLARARTRPGFLSAGLLFTAALMTRPDGAIPYAVAVAWCLALPPARMGRRALLPLLAPGVVLFLPYFAWRWSWYGYPFPNTYYAKSGGGTWLEQGVVYLRLFLESSPILAAVPLVAVPLAASLARARRESSPPGKGDRHRSPARHPGALPFAAGDRAALLALAVVAAYTLWVVKVGGDFMAARFLVPVTPLAYLLLDHLARSLSRPLARGTVLVAIVVGTLPGAMALVPPEASGIVNERTRYPADAVDRAREQGAVLRGLLSGLDARVVFYGSQAMLAYYADFPVAIEGETGLTDAFLAHRPVETRTRPGHEKPAPLSYLRERGVQFVFAFDPFRLAPEPGLNDIDLGGVRGRILLYDRALMDALRARPGVRFQPIEDQVARFEPAAPTLDCAGRDRWLRYFRDLYLDHQRDEPIDVRVRTAAGSGAPCPGATSP